MVKPIIRFEPIEIPMTTTSNQVSFPDMPNLRDAYIQGIELYAPANQTKSIKSGGTPLAIADLQICTVTLYDGDVQIINGMPILNLNRQQNQTSTINPFVRDMAIFADTIVSWTKCFVSVRGATGVGTAGIISLGVYYYLPKDVAKFKDRIVQLQQIVADMRM